MAEMSKKRCVIVAAGSIDDTSAIKAYADSADLLSPPMRDMFIAVMPVLSRICLWAIMTLQKNRKHKMSLLP